MAEERNNLICSHCGAIEPPIQKEGIWRCKYCGIKRPSPYDLTDDICIELNMANNFRMNKHFGDALEIYERILEKDKDLEEANWGALVSEYGIEFVEDHGDFVPTVHRVNQNPVQKMPYYAKLSEEYRSKADRIEAVRLSVWQKVEKIPPYDVFICYKETDDKTKTPTHESKWARDLYYNLTHKFGLRVFYAPEVIAKSNAEYEPQIYAALQSAKLMVVLASKKEYVEAPWVKNEWSRFAKFAKQGSREKVIRVMLSGIDPAALPAELRNRQVFDRDGMWEDDFSNSVSELFNSTPKLERKNYEGTKIGTKQALKQSVNKRTFATYSGTSSISEATELENAKSLGLKLGKFDLTVKMCEGILEKNKACHEAYYIKLLAENRCKTREEFLAARGIVNIKTLEDAIATGDGYEQQVILRTVHDKIKKTKDFGLYKEYITFPGVRDPEIAELTEMFLEDAISRCDTAMFDEAIKAVASLDKYLKMHHGIIRALKENGAKKNSQKIWQYLRAVLEHDEGNGEVLWEAYCMEHGLYDKAAICKHCLALESYEELEKLYEYGYNAYVSEALLTVCLEGAEKQTAASVALFDFLLKLIPEKANELFDRYLRKFLDVLFKYGKFEEASKYNDQLLAMDKYDHTAYFNRVLIKYKTNNLLFFLSMYDELLLDENFSAAIETYGVRNQNQENRYRRFYVALGEVIKEVQSLGKGDCVKRYFPYILRNYQWSPDDMNIRPKLAEKIRTDTKEKKENAKGTTMLTSKISAVVLLLGLLAFGIVKIVQWCNGLSFELSDDGTYYICTGSNIDGIVAPKEVEIPEEYKGLPVKGIGDRAFSSHESLTSIVIPNSVTSIGYSAFSHCDRLKSIVIPSSVESMGDCAFQGCDNLESVVMPDSITNVGSYSFDGCVSLVNVEIGDNVKSIGESAFGDCSSLASIEIPDSVENIGNYAFSNCMSLTSIEIPDSVENIGDYAFSDCTSLAILEIGNSVVSFGRDAFGECDNLTNVELPDSLEIIGRGAFYDCDGLTSIIIPDNVESIGIYAFSGCEALTSVVIGDSVKDIADEAFWGCSSLISVVIGDGVENIGKKGFDRCNKLGSVFYVGTTKKWSEIAVGSGNDNLIYATRYYYSEFKPVSTGNFWHYDANGEVVIWE